MFQHYQPCSCWVQGWPPLLYCFFFFLLFWDQKHFYLIAFQGKYTSKSVNTCWCSFSQSLWIIFILLFFFLRNNLGSVQVNLNLQHLCHKKIFSICLSSSLKKCKNWGYSKALAIEVNGANNIKILSIEYPQDINNKHNFSVKKPFCVTLYPILQHHDNDSL